MVTFQELNDLRLGKLQSAVADWQTMVDKLVKVADGGDGEISAADLAAKAKAADWKGHNATVTKEFVTVTAREFDDVVTVARSVHTILSGAHGKLTKHKSDLADAVSRAAKKNIYVNDKGVVNAAVPSPQAAGGAKIEPPTQAEIDAVAKEQHHSDRGRRDRQHRRHGTAFPRQGQARVRIERIQQFRLGAEEYRGLRRAHPPGQAGPQQDHQRAAGTLQRPAEGTP